ncbi:peptide-methionine (S)-S-oxide reductase MsrA [Tissierella creatinophila]|uniref:Peptide methionine sulfoxide reductase MsrA n=1 Tax=Tissierella creatinophila DSM 6911 TaxID=1123403 RepID=A0A1U7M654_TISCR|nr:peptide-methionine (S)-S-oxide reductase MsrA [Tissierella creatinophila]OLS02802.1 peptide methionine sulfoxide reductase MsrA/MsrB [Tissierella creatinophila DSM 6911]
MKDIYLAGGCFWGVEEYFSRIKGVVDTDVGYANGRRENPSYEQVCTGTTGHTETTYVMFDENVISLKELLNKFWHIIDPTMLNRQGPDKGTQYRTGIYYTDEEDKQIILETLEEQRQKYSEPIVTEIEPLKSFFKAEEYHQDYLKKNPGGYCHIDLNN